MRVPFLTIAVLALTAVPAVAQDPGWIGVTVADRAEGGVLVQAVQANSPAAKAGLQANDIVREYNGQPVTGVLQLTRLVQETPVGRMVGVRVRRGNDERTFEVTTERVPGGPVGLMSKARIQLPDLNLPDLRDMSRIRIVTEVGQIAGLSVQSLTPQLRQFFGVTGEAGVLVASVDTGSPAEAAGIKVGDVLTSVAGITISSPQQFAAQMRSSGATVVVKVVRDKQEREITIQGVTRQ